MIALGWRNAKSIFSNSGTRIANTFLISLRKGP